MRKIILSLYVLMNCISISYAEPTRIIVGYPPGGTPDILARILAEKLSTNTKTYIVENRPGANGSIATSYVAMSNTEGNTLLLSNDSMITVNPHLYKLQQNPIDLVPVINLASNPYYILAGKHLPVKTFNDFISLAKTQTLVYGTVGVGSIHHLTMEMIQQAFGVKLKHIPYTGGSEGANRAIQNGEIDIMPGGGTSWQLIKGDQATGLAVTSKERLAQFQNLPTVSEYYQNFEVYSWFGIFVSAGTSNEKVEQLYTDISNVLKTDEIQNKIQTMGLSVITTNREKFIEQIKMNFEIRGKLIKDINLKLDNSK